jgi:hypothetical protein
MLVAGDGSTLPPSFFLLPPLTLTLSLSLSLCLSFLLSLRRAAVRRDLALSARALFRLHYIYSTSRRGFRDGLYVVTGALAFRYLTLPAARRSKRERERERVVRVSKGSSRSLPGVLLRALNITPLSPSFCQRHLHSTSSVLSRPLVSPHNAFTRCMQATVRIRQSTRRSNRPPRPRPRPYGCTVLHRGNLLKADAE